MSEKKTAEIKLRIEPSVKAQWQQSAADEGIGLSEFVVKSVAQYRAQLESWAKLNQSLDSTALINNAIKLLDEADPTANLAGYNFPAPFVPVTTNAVPTSEAPGDLSDNPEFEATVLERLGGKAGSDDATKKFGEDWKPWDGTA